MPCAAWFSVFLLSSMSARVRLRVRPRYGRKSRFEFPGVRIYLLVSDKIIERINMIENTINRTRSHFVLLGSRVSFGLFCLVFEFLPAILFTYHMFGKSIFHGFFKFLKCYRLRDVRVRAIPERLVNHELRRLGRENDNRHVPPLRTPP